jgi:dTDP-N-acetylfucosamine:lipid II N-acetylfucosaminyltransferase
MPRVAHFVLDQKFIDDAISIFDCVPGIQNEYLLVSRDGKVSHISARERITLFRSQFARLRHTLMHAPDIIVLHSLFFGASLVPVVSRRAAVVWISWGQDLYKDAAEAFTSSYPMRYSLFMQETRKWIQSQNTSFKGRMRKAAKSLVRNVFRSWAIKRIEYVSTCLPYEYPIIRQKYPHLAQFDFDYIDKTAVELPRCNGFSILVGNSASINCNHLDIIRVLADRNLKAARVIAPLSYAGGKDYVAAVIQEGKKAFGDGFLPLVSFMAIDEYTRLLRSCGNAVMGFLRQQATKNIQLLLYQGTKIFFYRNTDIFKFFKESGFSVFSIEDDLTDSAISSALSDEQVNENQRLLAREFDFDGNLSRVGKSIKEILAGRN